MLESEWGLSRVIDHMQSYLVIAVCTICMEVLLFERNVQRTRNGGIEGSLFCLRNVLMETSVKKTFYLPGMVESRDWSGSKFPQKDTYNQPEFFITTVTKLIWSMEKKLRKERILVWRFSPHHLFQRFQLLHLFLWNNIDIDQFFEFNSYYMALSRSLYMLLTLVIRRSFFDWRRLLLSSFVSEKNRIQMDAM